MKRRDRTESEYTSRIGGLGWVGGGANEDISESICCSRDTLECLIKMPGSFSFKPSTKGQGGRIRDRRSGMDSWTARREEREARPPRRRWS